MKRKILLFILSFAIVGVLYAQSEDRKWAIGFSGGAEQYNGDLGNDWWSFDQAFYGFGALSLARYLNPHLDLVAHISLGEIGHLSEEGHFNHQMWQTNLHARYTFFKYENSAVRPYLLAGIGFLNFEDKADGHENFNNTSLPVAGAGLNFRLSPGIYLQLQEMFLFSDYDAVDGVVDSPHDSYLMHSVGLVFNLGAAKDEDGDGVKDKKDKCPGTPAGVVVDDDGCPVDSDMDGIPDYQDECPQEAGPANTKGCPDKDGDGIADKDDDCPDVAGLPEFKGCPDTDEDGIMDKDDACPEVAGLAEFNGCPDRDSDGIIDSEDECPDEAGIPELNGCPKILKADVEALEQAEFGIQFEFAKTTLTTSSKEVLDGIVEILELHPHYKLLIEGHTDSKGKDSFNMKLSKDRAASVEKYIEGKGIEDERINSVGYGETKPVADNETEEGRAKNRRVELIIEVD